MMRPAFWLAALQIMGINILLSGDNAVVIALAVRALPPKERFWGMVLGAGAAAVLLIVFTGIVATLMKLPYLKLAGGLALFWVAIKLVSPQAHDAEDTREAVEDLWRAVRRRRRQHRDESRRVIAVAAAAGATMYCREALPSSIPSSSRGALFIPDHRALPDRGVGWGSAAWLDRGRTAAGRSHHCRTFFGSNSRNAGNCLRDRGCHHRRSGRHVSGKIEAYAGRGSIGRHSSLG